MTEAWAEHDRRVRPYVWSHRVLGVLRSLLGFGLILAGLATGVLESVQGRIPLTGFLHWLVYFALLGAVWEILSFPFSVGHWRVERRFGLSKQTFWKWMWDHVKGWMVGGVLAALTLAIVYACIKFVPGAWWALAATLLVLVSIVLAQLAPVVLLPLFFKLRPMQAGPLKDRLLQLSKEFGVEVRDVYHLGLGEKTEKGNAMFTGLGRTKRILIGDTLYEKHPPEQVEAVFAHELGHQVHNDLWKGIGFSTLWIYVTFFAAQAILGRVPDQPYAFLLFGLVLVVVQLPVGVIEAVFSRSRERAADEFAASRLGLGARLADALEQLTFQNWGYFRPNPVLEFLTYSHPAPWRRITALRGKT